MINLHWNCAKVDINLPRKTLQATKHKFEIRIISFCPFFTFYLSLILEVTFIYNLSQSLNIPWLFGKGSRTLISLFGLPLFASYIVISYYYFLYEQVNRICKWTHPKIMRLSIENFIFTRKQNVRALNELDTSIISE